MSIAKNSSSRELPNWGRLGLGTGNLASLGSCATIPQVMALLSRLSELNQVVIDTADSYGSGACERLLGRALKTIDKRFVIVSKIGYRYGDFPPPFRVLNQFAKKAIHKLLSRQCFNADYIIRGVEKSISRLSLDQLDVVLLHSPPLSVLQDDSVYQACEHLLDSGKVRQVGISSQDPDVISHAIGLGLISVIETPANPQAAAILLQHWKECVSKNIMLVGNHIYNPQCVADFNGDHQLVMRVAAALFPAQGVLLSGTRNPEHFCKNHMWAGQPVSIEKAMSFIERYR